VNRISPLAALVEQAPKFRLLVSPVYPEFSQTDVIAFPFAFSKALATVKVVPELKFAVDAQQ